MALQPLADLAVAAGVRAVEAPFADLDLGRSSTGGPLAAGDDPAARLARSYRFVLAPGTDPAAAVRTLSTAPGVESVQLEPRYAVLWVDPASALAPAAPRPAEPAPAWRAMSSALDAPPVFDPNDPYYVDGTQWGLRNTGAGRFGGTAGFDIDARHGWPITTGSRATLVSIVDTGFDLHHPELNKRTSDGLPRVVKALNGSIEGIYGTPDDSIGHGTLVAGIALALTNNGAVLDGTGVAGVIGGTGGDSIGCRVIEVKATPTHYTDALASELSRSIVLATDAGARSLNLSFGGDDDNDEVLDAISYAQIHGCTVVCGAGNGTDTRPQYPGYYALYGNGVSVASINSSGALSRFSTRGAQIDVVAPGENIMSTYLTYENAYASPLRDFEYSSGTSFAAPFVTGLAGLAATLQPSIADNEFQEVLRHSARDLGDPGRDDTFGWGLADAPALLSRLVPPQGFFRGSARAASWALVGTDSITLARTRLNHGGCEVDGRWLAQRYEVRAHVTLPAGLCLAPPQVIVHTHGSNGWSASTLQQYNLGWGEAVPGSVTPGGFDLRAYVYFIAATPSPCSTNPGAIGYVPVQPRDVRFDWAVLARLDAPPAVRITNPTLDGTPWPVDTPDTLRWTALDPDTVSFVQVAQSLDGGATWATLVTLPGSATSYAYAAPCGAPGESLLVRVRAFDAAGGVHDQGEDVRALVSDRECQAGESPANPPAFALLPVTPNPVLQGAVLRLRLPDGAAAAGGARTASLAIYDARGRVVRRFMYASPTAGPTLQTWDGRDDDGRRVPAGVYFAHLSAGSRSATQRFVLLGGSR